MSKSYDVKLFLDIFNLLCEPCFFCLSFELYLLVRIH